MRAKQRTVFLTKTKIGMHKIQNQAAVSGICLTQLNGCINYVRIFMIEIAPMKREEQNHVPLG